MDSNHKGRGKIDEEGRIVLPREMLQHCGLRPGAAVIIQQTADGVIVRRSVHQLSKVYLEPTNFCNLTCRICIRRTWNEPQGYMSLKLFQKIIDALRTYTPAPTIFFGGFGEPLLHPDIVEMVATAKSLPASVELITNATLLHSNVSYHLIKAGIDRLWISLDGGTAQNYNDIRPGSPFYKVIENVASFRDRRKAPYANHPKIGIVFVAMHSNIHELPDVLRIGNRLGASNVLVTNVLPYTREMCDEILYTRVQSDTAQVASPLSPNINLLKMDVNEATCSAIYRVIRGWRIVNYDKRSTDDLYNYCPFIERGSTAISWDGNLSPCLPLMHSHVSFLHDRRRFSKRYVIDNLKTNDLHSIWNKGEYAGFRERVQLFDFAPCTFCGGCDLSEANEEDCFGNCFPACGGCLWAQGIIRCP